MNPQINKLHPLIDIPTLSVLADLEKCGSLGLTIADLIDNLKIRKFCGERLAVERIYKLRRMGFLDVFLQVGGKRNVEIKFYRLSSKGRLLTRHLNLSHLFRELEQFESKELEVLKEMEKEETVVS